MSITTSTDAGTTISAIVYTLSRPERGSCVKVNRFADRNGDVLEGTTAEIEVGKWIKLIWRMQLKSGDTRTVENVFKVGDQAVWGCAVTGYHFLGPISKITEKTVTIDENDENEPNHRLSLYNFAIYNRGFDMAKIKRDNENATW